MKKEKIYLHYDMDAFFAAIEQRDNRELRGKPIAIGHGVVTTASYEARKYGVNLRCQQFRLNGYAQILLL